MGNNQRGQSQTLINEEPLDRAPTIQRSQTMNNPVIINDNPIKKEDLDLDPLEQQVQMVFDELIESINQLDQDIEAMVRELNQQQQ
ncbi:unnamed protein product [Paramecium primaurelia]|uniref:Uncharacterized protein n=1 Tax=Paramecium primaurelia TaxID=5886 RepID=A0A8S1JQ44_PARPR|nr:unnamed protein product [Paramecium primaurelia]